MHTFPHSLSITLLGSVVVERLRRRRARRRRNAWSPFHLAALLCTAVAVHATSVTPPSFAELVDEAQVVARGTVTSVTSRWVDSPNGRVIKTFVAFAVEKRIKGEAPEVIELEFLGGAVGAESLKVGGMPQFKVGEREILFVRGNGVQFCPLVRFMHGRYRVAGDAKTGRAFVSRDDRTPVESVDDVQLPADSHGITKAFRTPAAALSPDAFEAEVVREAARQRR